MTFDLYEVVTTLTGRINPVGDSGIDKVRLEHLNTTIELADRLISTIARVRTENIGSHEGSVKHAAYTAEKYLRQLKDELGEMEL